MSHHRDQWLTQICSNPSDWQTMLVFADFLELDEGDLLAAEQWRFLAVVYCNDKDWRFHEWWPRITSLLLTHTERYFAAKHNIRCMPTYPKTIEDVERYYTGVEVQEITA